MPTLSLTETTLRNCEVKWKTITLGYTDEVDPTGIKIKTMPLKVGTIGDVRLGEMIIELEGSIKTTLRQISLATIQQVMPWYSSGSIPLLPATIHKDLYDYADALKLHPLEEGATATKDLNLLKAVPKINFAKRDGEKFAVMDIEWVFFPDRTALPTLTYGYVGDPPA